MLDELQIRQLMKDQHFIETMSKLERIACLSFKDLVNEFLGNTRAINYAEVVNKS